MHIYFSPIIEGITHTRIRVCSVEMLLSVFFNMM